MPKIPDMRRTAQLFLAILAVYGAMLTACNSPPTRQPARPRVSRDEVPDQSAWLERVVELHNRERAERKLPPFEIDPKLQRAAELHAADMARRQKMSHRGADWSSPFDRMKRVGYVYQSAAENVAYGQTTPEEAVDAWMHSPPHRRAILGNYSQIGAGYATATDGTAAWCVTFGDPAGG